MIKLIVFDLDGTIADSKKAYLEVIQKVLAKNGFDFSQKEISDALGPKLKASLLNLKKFKPTALNKLSHEINSEVETLAPDLKAAPYAEEVLRKLSGDDNYNIILMTNSTHRFAHNFVHNAGLEEYFDEILGAEDFLNKVTAFRAMFRQLKVNPDETLYVGDKTSDHTVAKEAGCNVLLVRACSWDREKIGKTPYSKHSAADLRDVIKFATKI